MLKRSEYITYLNDLIPAVFKILPLYEEEMNNEERYLDDYINSLIRYKILGLKDCFEEDDINKWYQETIVVLTSMRKIISEEEYSERNRLEIRKEMFKLTNMISKHIKELEG